MSSALAAGETPAYLGPIVVFIGAAALIGFLSIRMRVVPIVGFLLAGVVIGPNMLGLVGNEETVTAAADIGIILLLFTIGIEFSLERFARMRRHVLLAGGIQVLTTVAVTASAVLVFGAGWQDAVFTGFLVSLSSTAIVIKMLAASGRTNLPSGQAVVGILIFQDLAVVLMVLLVPSLSIRGGAGGGPLEILKALGIAALVLVFVLVVARKVMPVVLEVVARTCSPEVFLLAVVAIGLGTAWLTSLAGVSVSLGAFLAGLVVSESRHSVHALGEILPLQILFSATFFVSIGMLLDLRFVLANLWLILGLALAVVLIKAATGLVALRVAGLGTATGIWGALLLAQIGEFSFVLQSTAAGTGLSVAGLGEKGPQALIAVTVLLMAGTPLLAGLGERLGRLTGVRGKAARPAEPEPGEGGVKRGPVLVSGWGGVAAEVGAMLRQRGIPVTVLTLSPDLAAAAERDGHLVVRGDSTKEHVLREAGAETARLIVIAEDEAEQAARISTVAQPLAPDVPIVVRATDAPEPELLTRAGADRVVDGTRAIGLTLGAAVLRALGLRAEDASIHPDTSRVVDFRPDPDAACPHTSEINLVLPATPGCTECLRQGRLDWVHLRTCLSCGQVGCCDSSPQRHARAHAAAADHPIAASAEPGESWAWCYLDETRIDPAGPEESG
ncbi:cation:proton antiporter [Rhizohabitans arisaemae]|uniref:cation:proton antiporter domain-containing protein n=1 Tax=Rhizohabitans arisaemae TaxID=2720610 RepID=UPI0024B15A5F|nr:cation:proton antiporter [Rhizohabitans arisaemae]